MGKRREIIFVPFLLKSLNDMFGAIKNPKLNSKIKLNMLKAIMGEHARYANAVSKHLQTLNIKPFDPESKIKISYNPFYGTQTLKTPKGRKRPNLNPLDCVNYSTSMKSIEDRLVNLEIIADDNYKIVKSNEILPAIIDRDYKGQGIFVIIEEIDDIDYKLSDEMKKLLEKLD